MSFDPEALDGPVREKGEAVEACDGLLMAFGMPGHWELLLVAGVIILLFFGRRIPEVMRSLGKGVTQFKKGLREGEGDDEAGTDAAPAPKALPTPERDAETEGTRKPEAVEAPPERDKG